MNIVLRTSLPAGALRSAIEHAVREADASVPIARLQDMNGVFENRSAALVSWRICSAGLPASRCSSRPSAPTAFFPTWLPSAAAK